MKVQVQNIYGQPHIKDEQIEKFNVPGFVLMLLYFVSLFVLFSLRLIRTRFLVYPVEADDLAIRFAYRNARTAGNLSTLLTCRQFMKSQCAYH